VTIAAPGISNGRAAYTLGLLSLVCMLNYYDRQLLAILVEPLKADLKLSDGQIGALSGLAFGVVYSVAAVPIARIADRRGRVKVLGAALGFWSLMTGLCGIVTNFPALLASRFGVGLGEAGGLPTTHAIIAEHFSDRWRGRALAVIAVMSSIGLVLGAGVGGWIADRWGWRAVFIFAAIPGLVLAPLVLTTVKESAAKPAGDEAAPSMMSATATLLRRRAFLWLCIGLGLASIGVFALQVWAPAFLMRRYGMSPGELGPLYSAVTAPVTIGGVLAGGLIGDWLSQRDARAPLWILALTFGLAFPTSLALLMAPGFAFAMVALAAYTVTSIFHTSASYALVQRLSGRSLRATGAALFLMIVNLVGLGFGPSLGGVLSDLLVPRFGPDALQMSLIILTLVFPLSVLAFLCGMRSVRQDVALVDAQPTPNSLHGEMMS
jgi:MFS family permease